MGYNNLTLDEYAHLSTENAAQLPLEGTSSGGSSTTTCLYDSSAIAAIKSAVDALATAVANLQSDITAIKSRMPQTGTVSTLTADDVWNYSRGTYDSIYNELAGGKSLITSISARMPASGTVSTLTASDVWSAATRTLTSTTGGGGATAQEVWEYADRTLTSSIPTVSEIQAGLAKTTDLPTVPTVAEIQSGLAKTTDIPTISNLETVAAAIKAKTDNLPAEPAAKSDVQITVNADGIDVPTVSEIWSHTTRTLTSQIPTVSDIQSGLATATNLSTLQTTANAIKTQTDKIPSTSITPSDLTALRTHGDSNWTTATGFATQSNFSQVHSALILITSLLDHWTVNGNTLTTYDDSGAVLKTYVLTRDSNNNITSIQEA